MKNKLRFMALLIVAVLCMTAFTVPAFAESGDYPDEQPEESHVEDISPVWTNTEAAGSQTPLPVLQRP